MAFPGAELPRVDSLAAEKKLNAVELPLPKETLLPATSPNAAVFDVGNVLLRWDPRHLYRKIFDDETRMEWFLSNVCTSAWNIEQDRGRDWDEAVALLVERHPDHETPIRAFHERWHETVSGVFEDNVAASRSSRPSGMVAVHQAVLHFREARERYPFLAGLDGAIVSGDERLLKPDPAIYRLLLSRYGLAAEDCVFVDDSPANVEGARAVGMRAVHYVDPMDLAAELRRHGFPV